MLITGSKTGWKEGVNVKRFILIGLIICILPLMVSGNFTTEGSLTGLMRLSAIRYLPPEIFLPGIHISQYPLMIGNNERIKSGESLLNLEEIVLESAGNLEFSVSCYWGSASSLQVYCGSTSGSKEIDLGSFTQSEVKSQGELYATLEQGKGSYYITVVNNSSGSVIVDELTVDVQERPAVDANNLCVVEMSDDYV